VAGCGRRGSWLVWPPHAGAAETVRVWRQPRFGAGIHLSATCLGSTEPNEQGEIMLSVSEETTAFEVTGWRVWRKGGSRSPGAVFFLWL
jgi:hypothetical protein